jgi:hypothetical protein
MNGIRQWSQLGVTRLSPIGIGVCVAARSIEVAIRGSGKRRLGQDTCPVTAGHAGPCRADDEKPAAQGTEPAWMNAEPDPVGT